MKQIKEVIKRTDQRPIKVVQFGEGNFLRAFVDWMIQAMNEATDFNGGIAVVQPIQKGLSALLEAQACLYTHYMKGMRNGQPLVEHIVNTSIEKIVNPYEAHSDFLALAEIPTIKIIVSNTTEAGIVFDEADRLEDQPQNSFPGKLTAFLYKRYTVTKGDKDKGFHILPCELIENNGIRLKQIVKKYAKKWDLEEDFLLWLDSANTFSNTLVDRIVPGFPREKIQEIWAELGYEDQLVVESELFNLWVIEDAIGLREVFPVEKTDCQVIFTQDVTPYKIRKVRILNGAHSSMVPIGYLYGLETVKEMTEHIKAGQLIRKVINEEIIPVLPLPEKELKDFADAVIERFENPFIRHELLSISLNSMAKYKARILPSLLEYVEKYQHLPKILTLALAAYIVFYKGRWKEEHIPLKDTPEIISFFEQVWSRCDEKEESIQELVEAVLGSQQLWEMNLNKVPYLTKKITYYVKKILDQGMEVVVDEVIR